jgi:transcriptional regulator with XRE-family HTH domain
VDIHERLTQLLNERGWTRYRLSKESGLSEETLTNIFKRGTVPSFVTLQSICNGFKITLSQFFAEGEMVELTPELKQLFEEWVFLTPQQKDAIFQTIRAMKNNSNNT